MAVMDIVSVQFMDETQPGEFRGREYTYYADVPLKAGDCVAVPSRRGESLARVTAVNIPDYRVEDKIRQIMRHITSKPVPAPKPRLEQGPVQLKMGGT